jgi:triacylglycerol lipase
LTPIDPISGTVLPEADTFANGITLTQQIITVTKHYGVPWLDVIGHSKGGVDAQTAIVYDGASQYVHNLITLASPHHGTPLADLVCGNAALTQSLGLTAGPGLCGSPAPGAISSTCAVTSVPLCTGGLIVAEMNAYRAATDAMTPTSPVTYFVGVAADWQDFPDTTLTGQTLQSQDTLNDNDGLVPVESACALPHANYLFTMPFNHYNMFFGHNAFPWIQFVEQGGGTVNRSFYTAPYSGTNGGPGPGPCAFNGSTLPSSARTALNGAGIVQMGRLSGSGTFAAALPIESGAQLAGFHLIVSGPRVKVSLVDPVGQTHALPAPSKSGAANELFGNTWQVNYQTATPARGTWHLALKGPAKAAYMLIMPITSGLQVTLDGLPEGALVRPGSTITLRASARDGQAAATVERLMFSVTGLGHAAQARQIVAGNAGTFRVPATPQIMTLTAIVTGKTADGSTFQRTFIRSLAVMPAAGLHATVRHS